jgi:putative iron-regulated protein
MKFTCSTFLVAIAAVTLSACMQDTVKSAANGGGTDKASGDATLEQIVIENIAQNVIVATYRDLRDATANVAEAAITLQKSPTQANLDAVQAKWKLARIPWESNEGFLFGPVSNVDKQIDVWPLSKIDLDRILAGRTEFTVEFIRGIDPSVKGFHTAEYLIFGDGITTNTKTIAQMTPAQINYLVSVTQVVAEETQRLYLGWTEKFDPSDANSPSYLAILQTHNDSHYATRQDVLREFVQGMKSIAIEVGGGKLSGPLGGNIDSADGSLVESQFSWNSLTDFQDNIHSMQNVYTGDYNGRFGAGLDELVKLRKPTLDAKIVAQMNDALKAIKNIGGPDGLSYTLAIKDPAARVRAEAAIAICKTLEQTLEFELLPLFQ